MDKYLNEDAITAEIMSYVKNRIYNYAVLIDGDWGTGKTYFIQKSIIPTLEGSGYMPIYISLYKQEDREDPFIGGLKAQYRILSLSDDPCSPQLWAHYAGNYTGACLCFRTDGKFSSAKKVQYFQRKPKPKTETMENQLEPSVEDCKKMVYSNWFLKQKGWEYEREWRIVEESTSNYFDYNPGELVGIILGTNLDSHIGDAIKHCVPSSVRILKAWPGQRTFEILITDGEYQKLGDGSPIPKITDIDSFLSSNV